MKSLTTGIAAILCAACLLASCSDPGRGTRLPVRDDWQNAVWADGEVDAKLSEGQVKYYKAVFNGAKTTSTATNTEAKPVLDGAPAQDGTGQGTASGIADEGDFTIVDYGPRGELPAVMRRPSVYVVFSRPVVPLSSLGAVMNSTPLMKIEPRLNGVFRWYGSRMLAFEAEEEIIAQRRYTVSLAKDIAALDGTRLAGMNEFSFQTEYLALLEIIPGDITHAGNDYGSGYYDESSLSDIPPERAGDFLLRFNYAVEPSILGKYLFVTAEGKNIPFTASRPPAAPEGYGYRDGVDRYLRITLRKSPPFESEVIVGMKAGAKSSRGSLGSMEEKIMSFHTLDPFGFREYSEYSWEFEEDEAPGRNPLYLSFSHPVKPESLTGAFSLPSGKTIPDSSVSAKGRIVRLNGLDLAPGSTTKIEIAPSVNDVYGRKLGEPVELTIVTEPESSWLSFPGSGPRMLEAGQAPKLAFAAKNMASGRLGVATVADPYELPGSRAASRQGPLPPYDLTGALPGKPHFGIIDLSSVLGAEGVGRVGIDWSFTPVPRPATPARTKMRDWTGSMTVQVTDLGVTMRYAYDKVICLVTRLSTGEPLPGATVSLMRDRSPARSAKTDASGLTVFSLAPGEYRSSFIQVRPGETRERADDWSRGWRRGVRDALRVRVELGADSIEFQPNESHDVWSGPVQATERIEDVESPRQVAFIFSDRKLYRPGEDAGFRGIDRNLVLGKYQPYRGAWTAYLMSPEWDAPPLATLHGIATDLGGFHGSFTIPSGAEPGEYSILYERGGGSRGGEAGQGEESYDRYELREWITVAAFRKQLFAVSVDPPSSAVVAGDPLSIAFSARYLSGGSLAGAKWNAFWTRERGWFDFGAEWQRYAFGPQEWTSRSTVDEKSGTLSPTGEASLSLATDAKDIGGQPWTYTFNLNVSDETSGRLVGASRSVFVHPAAFSIGLGLKGSSGPWFAVAAKGKPASFQAVLVDPEGKEYAGSAGRKASVEILKVEWKVARQNGAASRIHTRYEKVETPFSTLKVDIPRIAPAGNTPASAGGSKEAPASKQPGADAESRPAAFSFIPDSAGEYLVRISSKDASGRTALTDLSLYVTGSEYARWNPERSEAIDMKVDKPLYLPGETARILVRSPLPAGRYLLTVEREGIFEERILELQGSTTTLEIPVLEKYLPVVYVALSSYTVRTGPAETKWGEPDLDKPRGLFGFAALAVDSPSRRIFLSVEPDKASYLPGSAATVTIIARDSTGAPVRGAEVSFMAADRGVLDLIDYHVPDPHAHFYSPWNFPLATKGADSRSLLLDPVTYELKDLQGGSGDDGKADDERSDFRSTAVFMPFLVTDSRGRAVATFPWPDSLTTWRCTAVASDAQRFGLAESEIQVRNPVNAKSLMPELLRLRDTVSAGILLTNLESSDRKVTVSASSDFLFSADSGVEKSLSLKPGESSRLEFRLQAVKTGSGKVSFAVRTQGFSETLVQTIRVESPGTTEAVSILGSTIDSIEEGFLLPERAYGSGSLELSLSSSLLPVLGNAFAFLFTYPYGCLEQRVSALMPLVLFGEDATSYGIDSRVDNPRSVVVEGLEYIAARQLPDGGFPYWPEGRSSNPYVSIRIAQLLAEAVERGYSVPSRLDEGHLLSYVAQAPWMGASAASRRTDGADYLSAYADYVLALHGFDVRPRLALLLKNGVKGGIVPYAFAGLALDASGQAGAAAEIFAAIRNHLVPTLRGVDMTDPESSNSSWQGGSREQIEALSLVLMLSRAVEPGSELGEKIARTLLARQRKGYWRSTAETVWALRALSLLIGDEKRAAAEGEGGIGARVTLGGKLLVDTDFSEGPIFTRRLPLTEGVIGELPRGMTLPLAFHRSAAQTLPPLRYTATLRTTIPEELALSRDEGLGIFTEVLAMDGKRADRERLDTGSLYRMRVLISSPRDRSFVALRVPVASGCEILDSRFVTAARIAERSTGEGEGTNGAGEEEYFPWQPETRQSILDNEVRYFFDFLARGRREMEFVFRAGTSGIYPLPPATAECMYEPEIFGRGSGAVTVITERAAK